MLQIAAPEEICGNLRTGLIHRIDIRREEQVAGTEFAKNTPPPHPKILLWLLAPE